MSRPRLYRNALAFSYVLLLVLIVAAALREFTWAGSLAVFLIFVVVTLSAVKFFGYPMVAALLLSFFLLAVHWGDILKYDLLRSRLQLPDFVVLRDFLLNGETDLFFQYWPITLTVLSVGLGAFALAIFLIRFERKAKARGASSQTLMSRHIPAAIVLSGALVVTAMLADKTLYADAIRKMHINRLLSGKPKLTVSAALIASSEYLKIAGELARIARADALVSPGPEPVARECSECPDLIIVHWESVFDPKLLVDFDHAQPVHQYFGKDTVGAQMRTNIWGGFSWVTEFEVMCGLNHELFGWAGTYTHYNIAPLLNGCAASDLKALGYKTHALYPARGSFVNVSSAFARYGVDRFEDRDALGLPGRHADITDSAMIEALNTRQSRPAKQPRFFWVSTNFNHGPHGDRYAKDETQGPYDTDRTNDRQLRDYVNRMNISIATFRNLLDRLRQSDRKVAVMFYGDHHPYFAKKFTNEAKREHGQALDFITPIVLFRNFEGTRLETATQPVPTEQAMALFLRFAGVSVEGRIARSSTVTQQCGGDQRQCDDAQRSKLLSPYLRANKR